MIEFVGIYLIETESCL